MFHTSPFLPQSHVSTFSNFLPPSMQNFSFSPMPFLGLSNFHRAMNAPFSTQSSYLQNFQNFQNFQNLQNLQSFSNSKSNHFANSANVERNCGPDLRETPTCRETSDSAGSRSQHSSPRSQKEAGFLPGPLFHSGMITSFLSHYFLYPINSQMNNCSPPPLNTYF